MRIVILDGHTMNPGDLNWDGLKALGDCVFYDRTPKDQVNARAKGAEAILTNKAILDKAAIDALPDLKYIGVTATGTNVVDLDAAKARGIAVTNVPAYSTPSVAQTTLALLLELTNSAGHYAEANRNGTWSRSADFCYWDKPIVELAGRTFGLIGFGAIGQSVAVLAAALGMKILVHVRTPRLPPAPLTVEFCSLEDLFRRSDVVSLHCPLTPETRELINARHLALMKPAAYVINTSRGPLVDEAALAEALNAGRIAGAGLDVLSAEPPREDNPLLKARNCIITPHIAWASVAARQRLLDTTVENLRAYINGRPVNAVNS